MLNYAFSIVVRAVVFYLWVIYSLLLSWGLCAEKLIDCVQDVVCVGCELEWSPLQNFTIICSSIEADEVPYLNEDLFHWCNSINNICCVSFIIYFYI